MDGHIKNMLYLSYIFFTEEKKHCGREEESNRCYLSANGRREIVQVCALRNKEEHTEVTLLRSNRTVGCVVVALVTCNLHKVIAQETRIKSGAVRAQPKWDVDATSSIRSSVCALTAEPALFTLIASTGGSLSAQKRMLYPGYDPVSLVDTKMHIYANTHCLSLLHLRS